MISLNIFIFEYWGESKQKNPENLTFFSNFVIKKLHMRKNSNDVKQWGVNLIRLKKNKFSKPSISRTYELAWSLVCCTTHKALNGLLLVKYQSITYTVYICLRLEIGKCKASVLPIIV